MRATGMKMAVKGLLPVMLAMSGDAWADSMTLQEAVASGLARSPEIGQAQQRVGQAEAVRDQVKRGWLPRVTIEGVTGLRHLENDTRINLGLANTDEYPTYASVSVDQPIFDFGRRTHELRSEKERVTATLHNRDYTAESTTLSLVQAYLQLMLHEGVVAASTENLTFHDRLSADMREGVSRGAMSVSERQQADERRQAARVRHVEAESELQNARIQFAALIGVAPESLVLPESSAKFLPATVDEAVALADSSDPRILEAQANFASAEAARRRAKSDYLPNLSANGHARTGTDFDGYRGHTMDYQALATLRWTIFDGGVNAARVRETEHRAEEARLALVQARRDSERDIRDTWQKLSTWRKKFNEQQERLAVASDVLISYRAQFGIGWRSLLDVLDAQSARFSASIDSEVSKTGTLLGEYALLAQGNRLRETLGVSSAGTDAAVYGPQ